MDNGHSVNQNPSESGFFTAGIGNISADQNPLPDTSNLEAETFVVDQSNLMANGSPAAVVNPSNLGSAALSSGYESHATGESYDASTEGSAPELGQVIELSMPPPVGDSVQQPSQPNQPGQPDNTPTDLDTVAIAKHFADDKISKSDIDYIKAQETKLSQDGNAADFYSFWQTARLDATGGSTQEESI